MPAEVDKVNFPRPIGVSRSCPILLLCVVIIIVLAGKSPAQTTIEDMHVMPPLGEITHRSAPRSLTESPIPSFKTRADLIIVPVSVTDAMNRIVLGLEKENFQIYENRRLQFVETCSNEDAPISLAILLDTSGSMQGKLDQAREAIHLFVNEANPEDELFVIAFSDSPIQLVDVGSSPEQIDNELLYTVSKGSTALFDAVYLAFANMRNARYARKAILLISDGGDNHSHYTERDIRRIAKESDVMIYGIGIYDHYFETMEERLGPQLLGDLSSLTGGTAFVIEDPGDLPDAVVKIGIELRNLYILSYAPRTSPRDGKWHKIKVKLLRPKVFPAVEVHAREGYYATAE